MFVFVEKEQVGTRKRLINRRQQGDLGEFSAMEWFAAQGARIWIPLGHSPDADLVVELNDRLLRIQVKTSTRRITTPEGHERWAVSIATKGGNQSWSGTTKGFDPLQIDYLFVLAGDGRRWLMPANAIEATQALTLGGSKYSEFEVGRGQPIEHLVYPGDRRGRPNIARGSA